MDKDHSAFKIPACIKILCVFSRVVILGILSEAMTRSGKVTVWKVNAGAMSEFLIKIFWVFFIIHSLYVRLFILSLIDTAG